MRLVRPAVLGLVLFSMGMLGCRGDELGRVPLTNDHRAPLTGEGSFPSGTKKIWIDYDAKWNDGEIFPAGTLALALVNETGEVVATSECRMTGSGSTKVCGTTIDIGGTVDEDCEMDVGCAITPPSGATNLKLRAKLEFTEANRFEHIKKIALVLRT